MYPGKILKKYILMTVGCLSLFLGILGIFLPLLPTVPFLLLTAYCFARSSSRLYDWLINHKTFGGYIYNYHTYRAITRKTKVVAIAFLWGSLGLSMSLLPGVYICLFLSLVGMGVTYHILSLQTLK
ncbi:YbaN family protein [Sporomusa aerivorans]|uniref:YbaN family protein n=1 Tax=Sporomusa aerivorans TaxID=204936 RepID=UPI00352AECFC